jgi:peroxiredoxin
VGRPVPGFALRDQHGATVTLASYQGVKAVVVMFYPFAFSRVCTGELRGVREELPRFESERVQLLAVSCDPVFALRAFAGADGLTFPLLSDFWPHGQVARAFGVFDEDRGCARRSTFVVDRDGLLRWQTHSPMPETRDLDELASVLAGL